METNKTEEDKFVEEITSHIKPLMKLLKDNAGPHIKILISPNVSEIIEGIGAIVSDDFAKENNKSKIITPDKRIV